jgi:DNA-binding NtrC family response regulator
MGEPPIAAQGLVSAGRASEHLIGSSIAMQELRAEVARVGGTDVTVLLSGPTGAGKDNVARALHAAGRRRAGRFEAVNCGAIPRELAEAELFGAEAGSYTGATRARAGRIEHADGGTLFLDEIGELPLEQQVKLLRFLETREIERLGSSRRKAVDVRIIAATNVDLERAVEEGRFRADLYWRLAVLWIDVPSLAERRCDIAELIHWFASAQGRSIALTAEAEHRLQAHGWPGNVRELRNLVDRAVARNELLLDAAAVERLLAPRRRTVDQWITDGPAAGGRAPMLQLPSGMAPVNLKSFLAATEIALIEQALEASGGAIAASARLLGLKRTTLVEKMRRMQGGPAANEAA